MTTNSINADSLGLENSGDSDLSNDWAVFSEGDFKECNVPMTQDSEFDPNLSLQAMLSMEEKDETHPWSTSTSSSDVDVIDEEDNLEKLEADLCNGTPLTLPAPCITFSSTEDALEEEDISCKIANEEAVYAYHSDYDDELEMYGVDLNCLVSIGKIILALTVVILLCNFSWSYFNSLACKDHREKIEQMEQVIKDLNLENADIKKQSPPEIHKKKVLELKLEKLENENWKINGIYLDAISDLQKHFSNEKLQIVHRNEINRLKEQINIMHFENEELQRQLVHALYRDYSSQSEPDSGHVYSTSNVHFVNHADLKAAKENLKNNENSESTSINLTENVKKLHEELMSEIAKIKKWNEIVAALAEKLQKSESDSKRWTLQHMKQSLNGIVLDAKKNIASTVNNFQNLNISNMFTKYMKYNERTVENVFSFFSEYFKPAQETMQKILKNKMSNVNEEATVNNLWSSVEKIGKKWSFMKDKFVNQDRVKNAAENPKTSKNTADKGDYHTMPSYYDEGHDRDLHLKEEPCSHSPDTDHSNIWLFKRAADRAKLRQNIQDNTN